MRESMIMTLNWANRITIFRILLIAPFVSFMLKTNDPSVSTGVQNALRYVALLIFLRMAISDGVDGYLARKRNQIRSYRGRVRDFKTLED